MKINLEELSYILKLELDQNEQYQETLYLTKLNTSRNLWLFGGAVYKPLVKFLYNQKSFIKDFDFFTEKINERITLIPNWKRIYGKFTNPKFQQINEGIELDIVPLDNIYHLKENLLKPNIYNFLKIAPLNIFSLVYDITNEKLIGDIGKQALERRTINVNDLKSAKAMARRFK